MENVLFTTKDVTDRSWAGYGYRELELLMDGKPTGYKAILRNGDLVSIVSKKYELVPNEVIEEVSDMLANEIGAKKLPSSGIVGNRFYGLYDLGKDIEPIRGVSGRLGYFVYNSIDSTLGYGVSVLTTIYSGGSSFVAMLWALRLYRTLSPTAAAAIIKKKHVGASIEKEKSGLKEEMLRLIRRAEEAIAIYRLWSEVEVKPDDPVAKNIAISIPKGILVSTGHFRALKEGVTLEHVVNCFDLFVDIGEAIWHGGTKSGKKYTIDRRAQLFRALCNALPRPE